MIADAFALGIGLGGVQRGKGEAQLLARVAGACPAGERIGPFRLGGVELQHPGRCARLAGLHRILRRLIDMRGHVVSP